MSTLLESEKRSNILLIDPNLEDTNDIHENVQRLRTSVSSIHVEKKELKLQNGSVVGFDKCILATGKIRQHIDSSNFIDSNCNETNFIGSTDHVGIQYLFTDHIPSGKHVTILG